MTVTTPPGRVVRDADGMRLEFVRSYDDPVQDVWAALTEPDRLARWFGRWSGDPATGSVELVLTAEDDDAPQPVQILACEPPARLVVVLPSPDGPWQVSASLEQRGPRRTRLLFVQRLAEPYDAGSIGPGWHYYLDRLGAVVAGTAVPGDWDEYYPALRSAYGLPDAG